MALVVAGQILTAPARRLIDRRRAEAGHLYQAAAELRRRAARRADPAAVAARGLRRRARRARSDAVTALCGLAVIWIGAQIAVWRAEVNAAWDGLPLDPGRVLAVTAGTLLTGLLWLWWALRRAGDPAARDRALAHTLSLAVAGAAVALPFGPAPETTVLSAVAVVLSPVFRRAVELTGTPRATIPLSRRARELVDRHTVGDVAELLDVVTADRVREHGTIGWHEHIRAATIDGDPRSFVHKRFTAGGRRELTPYREMLSRIDRLPPDRRDLAARILLWPVAVVADGDTATGVLYERITSPFLLVGGDLQTGDYLCDEEPDYTGSRRTTVRQRAEIARDVAAAHELLHSLGLAHGDTAWKNFAYGVRGDTGVGLLIDTDGVVAADDRAAPRIHQPLWETPDGLTPAQRDVVRVALLTARLAHPEPDLSAAGPPAQAVPWFTPELRGLVERILAAPARGSIGDLADALRGAVTASERPVSPSGASPSAGRRSRGGPASRRTR
ncbi:hypothetical protein [Actinoplanes flavus]|uniref:Protein kinase domain-containing protein n=1 Tax=Actinoplanes flavus TaxID=2820290 RepID=A0ABS3UVP2_9ACTN|nr:hypothetical protein [Actinoplanes flavus]MBO3742653.1 hypothetical protein [Actinoplanes flavus]